MGNIVDNEQLHQALALALHSHASGRAESWSPTARLTTSCARLPYPVRLPSQSVCAEAIGYGLYGRTRFWKVMGCAVGQDMAWHAVH